MELENKLLGLKITKGILAPKILDTSREELPSYIGQRAADQRIQDFIDYVNKSTFTILEIMQLHPKEYSRAIHKAEKRAGDTYGAALYLLREQLVSELITIAGFESVNDVSPTFRGPIISLSHSHSFSVFDAPSSETGFRKAAYASLASHSQPRALKTAGTVMLQDEIVINKGFVSTFPRINAHGASKVILTCSQEPESTYLWHMIMAQLLTPQT
jgi:hypothetical protein